MPVLRLRLQLRLLELGRLLDYALMNYSWNEAWTAFVARDYAVALPPMERTAKLAPDIAEVFYDLAVVRLANGDSDGAIAALTAALERNPKLRQQAAEDSDLDGLRDDGRFADLLRDSSR